MRRTLLGWLMILPWFVFTALTAACGSPWGVDEQEYREVVIAAGTTFPVELHDVLASNTSGFEDPVHAAVRSRVLVNGVEAVPAGTLVSGVIVQATHSGAVNGRGRLAFDFRRVIIGEEVYDIRTKRVYQTTTDAPLSVELVIPLTVRVPKTAFAALELGR